MQALPEFDLLLFGGTGDLAMRKLLPALYRRYAAGQLAPGTRVIGIARTDFTREQYIAKAMESCRRYVKQDCDEKVWQSFSPVLDYVSVDGTRAEDMAKLKDKLAGRDNVVRVFFLSTAPDLFQAICSGIGRFGLATPMTRVVLEKPLGYDAQSAAAINDTVATIFSEPQIFRIDHYLGKETVQNLLALRFGNCLFEPLWRRGLVRNVQITVSEQLGVERRANFYDRTGALRDMVQNHLLQLLCIIAMEPPSNGQADAVRDEKLKVLKALQPITGRDVLVDTVHGQYKAGAVNGTAVQAYIDEENVRKDSTTETFVAMRAHVENWRWAGVPFYLRTGKRLSEAVSEIVLTFEEVPYSIFKGVADLPAPNRLIIRLQPDESIMLEVLAKNPGDGMVLKPVSLCLDFSEAFNTRPLDAYERLLMDIVRSNLTLFMRRDELDAAWRWIDPIRAGWAEHDEKPKPYMAGSWGPTAAMTLVNRDGFSWHGEA
ncbi:MAG: glucose-6-phosphate dehydrogenase [Steroidobacteraceae bacterium]